MNKNAHIKWPLLALLIAMLSSCTYSRYDEAVVNIAALRSNNVVFVVTREKGTSETIPGPCPQVRSHPTSLLAYRVIYSLPTDATDQLPIAEAHRVYKGSPNPKTRSREAWASTFLNSNECANYFHNLQAPETLSAEEIKHATSLGFDMRNAKWVADDGESRWLLGFPFGSGTAQVCSLTANHISSLVADVNYSAIWDYAHHRVAIFQTDYGATVIAAPTNMIIWNYTVDTSQPLSVEAISKTVLDRATVPRK